MNIKICGITNEDDAHHAVSLGADAVGFIFYENSPRYITPEKVEEFCMFVPPFVRMVGVFVNEDKDRIKTIVEQCKLDLIQLHGNESPQFCMDMPRRVIKAINVADLEDVEKVNQYQGAVSAVLLDTKAQGLEGGSGKTFDWGLALKAKEFEIPIILAGGINENNVKKAVQLVNPYAVDLCSSVESEPGIKDYNKMKEIITVAKPL